MRKAYQRQMGWLDKFLPVVRQTVRVVDSMTINQAIRILDPDTSAEALGEIKYYGELDGYEKMMAACEEACRMAVEIMRQHLKE